MLKKIAKVSLLSAFGAGLFGAEAHAKDGYFVLNTVALHFDNFKDRNAVVPGVGWEYSPSRGVGWHVGTFSDSFGTRATYTGVNYATRKTRLLTRDVRVLLGATVLHKQYHVDTDPETKLLPLPAVEISVTDSTVLNVSGSPEMDFNGSHNNAVMFFQLKMNIN
ncbi:MAG: hypothetical protein KDJ38_11880 [Gammaproteobacteria bacterium]|nr:hypothetical protein [Gammaproteobacteria bacterium]